MNRETLYKWIIGGLLLANVMLIAYLFWGHHYFFHKHFSPREKIIKELKLNKEQQETFDAFYVSHRSEIDQLQKQIAQQKKIIYNQLGATHSQEIMQDSLFLRLSQLQGQLEQSHFLHFKQLRSILRKDQLADFDRFITELQHHIHRHHHRKHHHNH